MRGRGVYGFLGERVLESFSCSSSFEIGGEYKMVE